MTSDMGFDIHAMVKPKTRADYVALLDEALSELKYLNELIDSLIDKPEPEA